MSQTPKHNRNLQEQLARFKELKGLNMDEIGKLFKYSGTTMCRYMKGEFSGNIERLEKTIEDGLRVAEARERNGAGLFDSHPVALIRQLANKLKANRWMGAAYGDAGIGKTCGTNKLLLADLSAWFTTTLVYKRDKIYLAKQLWAQMGNGTRGRNRMDFIEEVCQGTDRLLIVDQAHLLNKMGRQFYCDLNDRTRLPIMFIGNPEMFEAWKEVEQQFSRLRIIEHITLRPSVCDHRNQFNNQHSAERAAMDMLRKHVPAVALEALREQAVTVANGKGHLRSLETTLVLARSIVEATGAAWAAAFDAAETQQVRNYKG